MRQMVNLDSDKQIKKIDKQGVLASIESLPDQCKDAWSEANKVNVPETYKDIQNIIMCGMGGSGLGARIIESVYASELKLPIIRINDYDLPDYVDHHSLVICSSYSGTTEEVVNCAKQAVEKRAKWMAIGTGNTLIDLAKKAYCPLLQNNSKTQSLKSAADGNWLFCDWATCFGFKNWSFYSS